MKAKEKKSQIMDDVEEIDAKGSTKGSDKATAKDAKKDSAKGSNGYGAEQITVLEGRDAVRKRPAMYIGSNGELGLHHLVYEIVDNAWMKPWAVSATRSTSRSTWTIRSPLKTTGVAFQSNASDRETSHHRGRHDHAARGRQVRHQRLQSLRRVAWRGRVGRQLPLRVAAHGDPPRRRGLRAGVQEGVKATDLKKTGKSAKTGTKITFKPDVEIFTTTDFSFDKLSERLREKAFLNKGIKITIVDERSDAEKKHEFLYEGGIAEFVKHLNKNKNVLHSKPMYFEKAANPAEGDDLAMEVAIQYNDAYDERSSRSPTTSTLLTAARTCPASARRSPRPSAVTRRPPT